MADPPFNLIPWSQVFYSYSLPQVIEQSLFLFLFLRLPGTSARSSTSRPSPAPATPAASPARLRRLEQCWWVREGGDSMFWIGICCYFTFFCFPQGTTADSYYRKPSVGKSSPRSDQEQTLFKDLRRWLNSGNGCRGKNFFTKKMGDNLI